MTPEQEHAALLAERARLIAAGADPAGLEMPLDPLRESRYGEPPTMPDIDPRKPGAPHWRPAWWPVWWRHIPELLERYRADTEATE